MRLNDVLYTPLDVVEKPDYSIDQLKKWLNLNFNSMSQYKDLLNTTRNAAEKIIDNYPWDLTVAYWNLFEDSGPGWLGNFDKEFPTLSRYLYECFDLSLDTDNIRKVRENDK